MAGTNIFRAGRLPMAARQLKTAEARVMELAREPISFATR